MAKGLARRHVGTYPACKVTEEALASRFSQLHHCSVVVKGDCSRFPPHYAPGLIQYFKRLAKQFAVGGCSSPCRVTSAKKGIGSRQASGGRTPDCLISPRMIFSAAAATVGAVAGLQDAILERTPFPIRAIQVDGGSEFMAQFEAACKESGVHLYVSPPRSPKLNRHVERAQRTHTEESRLPASRSGSVTKGISICLPFAQRSALGSASTTPSYPIRPWHD